MEARKFIEEKLKEILNGLSRPGLAKDFSCDLKISEKSENGDFYTNAALVSSKIFKQKPLDIAYKIKDKFESVPNSIVEKVEIVPPGFVNFFLSEQYLVETLAFVKNKGEEFGGSEKLKNKKIMVEYTDPNPFKEFHIGHLYSNIVGESLSRLFESKKANVWRVCYQGDVGLHVAKAIYGMIKLADSFPSDSSPIETKAQFMGKAYAQGTNNYEINDDAKNEINDLNKKLYKRSDPEINELYDKGKKWSLEYFDLIYKRLGTSFKKFYFESEAGEVGLNLVRTFQEKGVFEASDGAIIFPGKKFGLHNRVFINSLGLPTYEAKELGLAPTKFADFSYDESVIVTGNEVNEYFRVVLKALSEINPDLAEKTKHISHGMVRLPGGKMSSRTGVVLTGEWLMDEVRGRVQAEFSDIDDETAEKVGIGAVKYALLKNGIGQDIEFNFKESISLEGNSGPYLQYTYVRTQSLIRKNKKLKIKNKKRSAQYLKLKIEELALLRKLVHFPETVDEAQRRLSPNIIALYLFELAQAFNLFYQKHQVLGSEFRLELSAAVGQVLKKGLNLLGIETVERM